MEEMGRQMEDNRKIVKEFVYLESWFAKTYEREMRLNMRYVTMKIALNWFLQTKREYAIETGSMKMADDWGSGCSTYVLGETCHKYGRKLYTVDCNDKHVDICKGLTLAFSDSISYHWGDSIEFLQAFKEWDKVGLLYLDSMDSPFTGSAITAQTHQMNEFRAAEPHLVDDVVVLLDDNHLINGGKTGMLKEYLLRSTIWICLFDHQQSLWMRRR